MTRFIDGPAAGKTLMLKRAPLFLRVTQRGDDWDALDQLDDQPAADEEIHVYRLQGQPGSVHMNFGRCRGGLFTTAEYAYFSPQPTDAELRTTAAWHATASRLAGVDVK